MSGDTKNRRFSESLVLDDSEEGVIITGITDDAVTAKTGLRAGDEIVAATIHLDHLNKHEVLNILKVLEPYDNNMKVLTKKNLEATAELGSLGSGPEILSVDGLSGKAEINDPTLNGDLPGFSVNKPLADAGTLPPLELKGPDLKVDRDGTLKAPDVSVLTPSPDTPGVSLNIEKPEIKTGKLKNNIPKFTMPQFNLPQLKTEKSDLISGDIDLPSVSGNLEKSGLNLSAPKLDLKSPELNQKGSKVDLNGTDLNADIDAGPGKIKWPHLNWKGPKNKELDADLNADLSDVKLPTASDVDIDLSQVDIKGPSVDVQTPNLDIDAPLGKINWPHLKWKKHKSHVSKADLDLEANLKTPDIDVSPKVEGGINTPDVEMNLQNINFTAPDLDVKSPNIDVESASGKVNWPHLKWKMPKPHARKAGLYTDTDLNTPDLDLSTPKIKGDINIPTAELNLPKADLKGPNIDCQPPDIDIDSPSGKINWPHLKWKKPKLHGPKANCDLNADLNNPNVDLSVPKTNDKISTPDVNLNLPKADIDVEAPSGKIRFPTLKKPKFMLSEPKIKTADVEIDGDVKAPDLSLSPPQASLDGPEVDLKLPKPDVEAPHVDTEGPSAKFKWPTLKKPKWPVLGHKGNDTEVVSDIDVSPPDLNISAPKTDSEINVTDVDINLPETDLEGPKLDINAPEVEGPSGKFKWFKIVKPKVGSLKGLKTDVDADVKVPHVDLKGPEVDLSGPDLNFSAPTIEDPDLDITMPNADVKVPDAPDFEIDPPNGNIKLPKLKLPKWPKVKGPELDAELIAPSTDSSLDLPNMDAPNIDIKTPDFSLDAAKTESVPDVSDLTLEDVPDIDPSAGKFKLPKIKIPKFGLSGPKVKGPNHEVNADLKGPDLDLFPPNVDTNLCNADLKASDVNLNTPELSLSAPKIECGVVASDLNMDLSKADLKGPNVDLNIPSVDTDTSSGKVKTPALELPEFNVVEPKIQLPNVELKTPDASVPVLESTTADVKAPHLNISDLNLPEADLNSPDLPKVDLQVPDLKLKSSDLSLSSPRIDGTLSAPNTDLKFPKADVTLNTGGLQLPASDIGGDISAPNLNINLPKAEAKVSDAQLKTPEVDLDSHLGDFKLPHFKLPKLGLSNPDVKMPGVDPSVEAEIEAPKVNIATTETDANISAIKVDSMIPKLEGGIKGPAVDVKAPNVDADLEKTKLPHFKLPKLSISGSKTKSPEVNTIGNLNLSPDGENDLPDAIVSASEEKITNRPEVDSTAEGDAEIKHSPKSKLRWPFKWGIKSSSSTEEEESGADSETDMSNAEVEVPIFKVHKLPRNTIDDIGGISDNFGLSKLDTEAKDYMVSKGIRLPVVNALSKAGEKVNIMERLKIAKEKLPTTNVPPIKAKTDLDVEEKPESALGLPGSNVSTSDENDRLSLSLSNMLGLNTRDSDAD